MCIGVAAIDVVTTQQTASHDNQGNEDFGTSAERFAVTSQCVYNAVDDQDKCDEEHDDTRPEEGSAVGAGAVIAVAYTAAEE